MIRYISETKIKGNKRDQLEGLTMMKVIIDVTPETELSQQTKEILEKLKSLYQTEVATDEKN